MYIRFSFSPLDSAPQNAMMALWYRYQFLHTTLNYTMN